MSARGNRTIRAGFLSPRTESVHGCLSRSSPAFAMAWTIATEVRGDGRDARDETRETRARMLRWGFALRRIWTGKVGRARMLRCASHCG